MSSVINPNQKGPKGDTGTAGTNGTNGTNGINGAAATIAVGTVTTGASGSSATVVNSGTSAAAVFNFAIPRGATGADGLLSIQRARVTTAADGTYTWTFPTPFAATPRVWAIVITAAGVTDVFNVQVDGTPTITQAKFRVNRTQLSVVALLGLTILSVPSSVGATTVDIFACPQ